jgi:dTDP-4-amino-4,6-dideoxygalactose transaminase
VPAIRFQRPELPAAAAVEAYFAKAREERFFSNGGPCFRLLRTRLQERTGTGCLPVANATLGLIAAISALRRPGGEIVLPSFTFYATVQAALWHGLVPRYVDIDPEHWHMDPERLRAALSTDVALVLGCSAFGTPPEPAVRAAWAASCAERGIPLLIDSAAGFGAVAADGVPVGAQGDAEVVSFHATKPFAVGEGGAVFSADAEVLRRAAEVTNFGLDAERRLARPLALNAKMSEVQAATALAVLDGFDAVLAARRAAADRLRAALADVGTFQADCERSTWQFVPLLLREPEQRARCLAFAGQRVELRTYYEPLHRVGVFPRAAGQAPLPVTEHVADRMLSLPMANDLTDAELDVIAAEVRRGTA